MQTIILSLKVKVFPVTRPNFSLVCGLGNTSREKKCFLSGIARMRGEGRALPELKNTLYIFLFDGRKSCTSCPNWGEGGEVIWAMPERKHSFFQEVFP